VRSERPDLVISDVMMPAKSGTRLCHDIKADPALSTIPVILLTAWAGSDATLHGYAQGADDFVAKPFHPQVLLARVRAQLLLRKMALEVVERERFAAIGTLAAGLLHEVRNPLNAMLNAARVLTEASLDESTRRRLLEVVSECAERIHGLTRTLDTHARPSDVGGSTSCDVHEGLDATLTLLAHRCEGVVIERDYHAESALARAPGGPVNQVFLNLIDNALNAGARRLWLRTESGPEQIEVHIRDDGPGVPPELGERIFDAFVSGSVNGSGLGLYLSRSIAEQHGGSLRLVRGAGSGTSFVVSLPKELS
jgi:signal transduction histidine kinase